MKKTKEMKKKVDKLLERRNELTFGRLIVEGAPANYQYIKASFGGDLPLRSYEIQFSDNDYGCSKSTSAEGRILVVLRGKCTYLEKAKAAESSGAAGEKESLTMHRFRFIATHRHSSNPSPSSQC